MKGIGARGVLVLSVVLGLGTSYTVYHYLNQAGVAAKPVPMVQVLTAATNIPARAVVTDSMLRVAEVPVSVKLPLAMASPSQAAGKVSKMPIAQGEQILDTKLFGDRQESGLAFVVPPGLRAVAVAVNEVVDSGGMIVPGDSVDVVAVLDIAANDTSANASPGSSATVKPRVAAVAQYILQNVEVLAVAQLLEGDPPPQTAGQKAAAAVVPGASPSPAPQTAQTQPGARTVTLAVSPQDAEKLILAEDKGRIRLVLRAHGDKGTVPIADDGLFANLGGASVIKTGLQPQ